MMIIRSEFDFRSWGDADRTIIRTFPQDGECRLLRAAPGVGAVAMALYLARYGIRDHAGRILFVFVALFGSFWYLARGNIAGHRRTMQITYVASCLVAGGFTLLPGRYLGQLLWGQVFGLV